MITIATKVYKEVEIELQDGTELTLRPLPIAPLRKFMDAWKHIDGIEEEEEGWDIFVNCAGIALQRHFKGKFDNMNSTPAEVKKGKYLSDEYKNYLEEVLDQDTILEIMEVCGGLNLRDPKVTEAVERAILNGDGTN